MAAFIKHSSPQASDMPFSTKIDIIQTPRPIPWKDYPLVEERQDSELLKTYTPIDLKIINQFFPPDYAATGQLIEELAHHLRPFGRVEVFTSQPSYAFDRDDSPRTENYESLRIRRSQAARFWPQRIRGKAVAGVIFFIRTALHLLRHSNEQGIVVLTTAPPFLPLLGYLLSRICNIRYVCLLYDLYPDIAIELDVIKKHHWLVKVWNRLNSLTWQHAEAIIVLSENMKERIVAKQPDVAEKIAIIPSWVDPEQIVPRPKHENWFAREHGLVEPFTVLYSGNMGRCHDMDTLLGAVKLLRDTPIRFVFIGSGEKRKQFQQSVADLGLKNCLFLPYQSRENLPYSLTACDVSIVSVSEGMEGLVAPSKLYSALASGRPIVSICPAKSYLNGVFAEANCGTTVRNGASQELAAYLQRLSQNPRMASELGRSGREFCRKNYTSEKIARDYLALFQSIESVDRQHRSAHG
ncbi:glycosyltransferase family 4 protein [Chamaesiphon sp. GL140_3_metabinner_50]|uniref:glycosyltransferase family 4 protein n=1 Tax=Chamaesiphon sp. GL140_3_metabinner_50 TaxID=2970812 RepID=UPI0025EE2B3F|nr:glycosyltransferase family 4 protein [Chamaesiphon sp. GL140_3_metabinner_50]